MVTRDEALAQLTLAGQAYELVEVSGPHGPVRVFANAPPTLRELYATTRSDLPFLVYEDERLTFEEVWRASCALAHALVADFGVAVGDRVAISMRNYPEWMIAFNAATSVGAVAVALNAMWQPHEFEAGLANCEPKVVVVDAERLARMARFSAPLSADLGVIAVRAGDDPREGVRGWAQVLEAHAGVDQMPATATFGPDDDAIMLYTSGSVGAPKGAVSSHRAVISALLSWELDGMAAVMTGLVPPPDLNAPQGTALLAIPLFHVTGLHAVYLASFRLQRRLISVYKWDPQAGAAIIARERVTAFGGPSAVTGDLVEAARQSDLDLSSLVIVGGGGAARAPEQVRAIPRVFPNARPSTGWGMTETNAVGVSIGADDYLAHPESSGRVSAVMDIMIGEGGELLVRGAAMFREYWRRPEATAESFLPGGWFRTGDVARIDEDGFCYIIDRIKDLVIRGGENIGCGAVEAALAEHPAVLEACVYGVPDVRLGEEVAASVYASSPLSAAELQAFLATRLARFEVPRYIDLVAAPLPRGDTGKILRRQLRADHAARLSEPLPI